MCRSSSPRDFDVEQMNRQTTWNNEREADSVKVEEPIGKYNEKTVSVEIGGRRFASCISILGSETAL
jgi:hypothetical protein